MYSTNSLDKTIPMNQPREWTDNKIYKLVTKLA